MKSLRLLLLITLIACGCHIDTRDVIPLGDGISSIAHTNFDSLAKGIADSAGGSIKNMLADTISANNLNASLRRLAHTLVVSLQDSLLTPQARKRLDSALTELLDTLSSPHNLHNINVLIANIGNQLDAVLDKLLGPARGKQLSDLVNKYLLGDTTTKNLLHLRDTLLGSKLDSLIARVMDTLTYGVRNQLTPALDTALAHGSATAKSTSSWILWTLGIISALLMALGAFFYIVKRRYQRMTELMTQEIDKIPNQNAYDELVGRIHEKANERELEPHLQAVLQKQGLLGKDKWHPKPKKTDS